MSTFGPRISHAFSDEFYPVSKGDQTMSKVEPFFGPPMAPSGYNPEDRIPRERWSTGELYKGRTFYLETAVSTMVKQTFNPFVTRHIMPMKEYPDIHFGWIYWHANRTLAPQTSARGGFETVTQMKTEYRATMNRYALGFVVSIESLDNDNGRFALALNVVNVAMSIGDTAEQLGLNALFHRKRSTKNVMRALAARRGNAADLFGMEKATWDIVRKDPTGRGFTTLGEIARQAMRTVKPTDVIIPEGIKGLLTAGPGNTDYFIFGDGARRNVDLGSDAIPEIHAGLRTHVVREITVELNGDRIAPMHRLRVIGGHGRLTDFSVNCAPSKYRRHARSIQMFNMDEPGGVFSTIEFLTGLENCSRWENDGGVGQLSPLHDELIADWPSRVPMSGLPKTETLDMFIYKTGEGNYAKVEVLGQMEKDSMPYKEMRYVGETIVARLLERDVLTRGNIDAGRNLINRIYSKNLGAADWTFLTATAAAQVAEEGNVLSGNVYGAHDFPDITGELENIAGPYLPAGYGSVAGMYTLASLDKTSKAGILVGGSVIDTATDFTKTVDSMFAALTPMFSTEHVAFDHNHTPEHFKTSFSKGTRAQQSADSKMTFAQNLIDHNKAPLVFHSGASSEEWDSQPATASMDGTIAKLADASAEEQGYIVAARTLIARSASKAVAEAFASTESINQFRENYPKSHFAGAYLRYLSDTAANVEEKAALRANKSFALFMQKMVSPLIENKDARGLAGVMHGVVTTVTNNKSIQIKNMEATLREWKLATPASASTSSSSSSRTLSAGRSGGGLTTRLCVAPSAMSRAAANSNFTIKRVEDMHGSRNADNEMDSRTDLAALFAHSSKQVFVSGAAVGSKRGRDEMMMGASYEGILGRTTTTTLLAGIEATANFKNKFEQAAGESDPMMRVAIQLLMLAPPVRQTFERLYLNDVRIPLDILIERSDRKYETGSCIFAYGGEEMGEIAWSKFNMTLFANGTTKEFSGHASIHMLAIVKREEYYLIAEDVVITQYAGGEGIKPITRDNYNQRNLNGGGSMMFFAVPPGSLRGPDSVANTHDIRGFYNPNLIENRLTDHGRSLATDKPHYPTALYYQLVFDLNELRSMTAEEADRFSISMAYDNTVTHQEMQRMWDPETCKYTEMILNTDHFGPNGVYEGAGDLRTLGLPQHYADIEYRRNHIAIA